MNNSKDPLVLRHDDYEILTSYLRLYKSTNAFDKQCMEDLQSELKRALLVAKEDFPSDVVRLNSRVRLSEEKKGKLIDLMLVTPEQANIKEKKISIMAPIGTAIIGFRKGHVIHWNVPAGNKVFRIVEVENIA